MNLQRSEMNQNWECLHLQSRVTAGFVTTILSYGMPWSLQTPKCYNASLEFKPFHKPHNVSVNCRDSLVTAGSHGIQPNIFPISNPDKLTSSACMHMYGGHYQTYITILNCMCIFSLHAWKAAMAMCCIVHYIFLSHFPKLWSINIVSGSLLALCLDVIGHDWPQKVIQREGLA